MRHLKYSEILAKNRSLRKQAEGSSYRVAVISNIVVAQLGDFMEFALLSRGVNLEVVNGDYDNLVQESSRLNDVDALVIFWEASNLINGIHYLIDSMDSDTIEKLFDRVRGEIDLVMQNVSKVPLVLFNKFSALPFCASELREGSLSALCRRLNEYVSSVALPNCHLVNSDHVMAKVGIAAAVDYRQFQSSKALYTINFLKEYVEHVEPIFLSVTGRSRKVLVMDCDNTLWGGVLGEDGATQIRMSDSSQSGKIYCEIQHVLKGFRKDGVLLALCSKNNLADVEDLLDNHPDMALRRSDFVAVKINWQDKAANLRELSLELNLGLDSFVFVDDSSFELELVRKALPSVALLKVPERLSEYPAQIRSVGRMFFSLSKTQEDKRKTEIYQEQAERVAAASQFVSTEDYLRSLGLRVAISWNKDVPVARAAQLTQKTNQFNLTTRRYTEADIEKFVNDENIMIASFAVSDRFGDHGVTGLAVIESDLAKSEARLDTFLMSCRVIGRNIEMAVFDYLLKTLQKNGVAQLHAEYVRSPKNEQVSCLLNSLGFELLIDRGDHKRYTLRTNQYQVSAVDYISVNDA